MKPHCYRQIILPPNWQMIPKEYWTMGEFFSQSRNMFHQYYNMIHPTFISDIRYMIVDFLIPRQILKRYIAINYYVWWSKSSKGSCWWHQKIFTCNTKTNHVLVFLFFYFFYLDACIWKWQVQNNLFLHLWNNSLGHQVEVYHHIVVQVEVEANL